MVSKDNLVPAGEAAVELRISNSRFIASAAPAPSVEEARAFLARIGGQFSDATHNVPVYIIGHGASTVMHCSDDGEPSGTAGRPALAVLKGSGIGDIAVVITRYFGGTKLGTGGLVRAYSSSMRAVLEVLPLARKVLCHTCRVDIPYSLYEQVKRLALSMPSVILEEEFTGDVSLQVRIAVSAFDQLQYELSELSRGQLQFEIEKENHHALAPLKGASSS